MVFAMGKSSIINNEKIFLVAYDLFMVTGIISVSLFAPLIFGPLQKIICMFEIFLLIWIELRIRKWNMSELLFAALCIILFFLCYLRNPIELAVMYIFLFCSRNISFRKIAVHSYNITLIMLFLIIAMSEVGIINNMLFEGYRYALGFRYVLYAPSLFLNVVLLKIYLEGTKIKWKKLILFLLVDIFLVIRCHAKLSFGLTFMALLYVCFRKISTITQKNARRVLIVYFFSFSFIFFFMLSIGMVFLYSHDVSKWHIIDHAMSGRLELSLRALREYPVLLFGRDIHWVGNGADQFGKILANASSYYYVDNAYLNLLLEEGLIFSIIVWTMYTMALKKCYRQHERILMVLLVILSLYFVFDNLKLRLIYNTFWLVIPKLILNMELGDKKCFEKKHFHEVQYESTI